jgi:NOL1/NOP2/sun family putative RNA methylase
MRCLANFRDLVDDWDRFRETSLKPLAHSISINRLRTSTEVVRERLTERGLTTETLEWYPHALRWTDRRSHGTQLEHAIGLYWGQEEAALPAVCLLDAQPGERVLDLCAAPGTKTAQIAMQMNDRGMLVANELKPDRMRSLGGMLSRLGITCAVRVQSDGRSFPLRAGLFDRVLVDVPCSCLGTSRKGVGVLSRWTPLVSAQLARVQLALLQRAIALCKPGGRVVYSTCTYTLQENEQVVAQVLKSGQAKALDASIEGFRSAPGVSVCGNAAIDEQLARTRRVWPHLNDTGGFFVALLEVQPT